MTTYFEPRSHILVVCSLCDKRFYISSFSGECCNFLIGSLNSGIHRKENDKFVLYGSEARHFNLLDMVSLY